MGELIAYTIIALAVFGLWFLYSIGRYLSARADEAETRAKVAHDERLGISISGRKPPIGA